MDQTNRISRKRDEPHPFILADHFFNYVHNKNHFYDENIRVGREIAS
jgi:hypothetical protein